MLFIAFAKDNSLSEELFQNYAHIYQAPIEKKYLSNAILVKLGQKIFFDTQFSSNSQMGCVTCHNPKQGFSDNNAQAISNKGKPLHRKSMSLYYLADDTQFFWDGRAANLENQFVTALQNPDEMNFSLKKVISILEQDSDYQTLIKKLQVPLSEGIIVKSVVAYIKSISPLKTQFDEWLKGDLTAMNTSQLKGFKLFNEKANCTACHIGYKFKDGLLNDIGLSDNDLGLGGITKKSMDNHMFKTPSLRGVSLHAPFMHDGSLKTLKQVVEHYNAPIFKRGDTDIPEPDAQGEVIAFHNFTQPLNLTEQEINDLVEFLKIL